MCREVDLSVSPREVCVGRMAVVREGFPLVRRVAKRWHWARARAEERVPMRTVRWVEGVEGVEEGGLDIEEDAVEGGGAAAVLAIGSGLVEGGRAPRVRDQLVGE